LKNNASKQTKTASTSKDPLQNEMGNSMSVSMSKQVEEKLISLSYSSTHSMSESSSSSSSSSLSSFMNNDTSVKSGSKAVKADSEQELLDFSADLSVTSKPVELVNQLDDFALFSFDDKPKIETPGKHGGANQTVSQLKTYYQSIIDDFDPISNRTHEPSNQTSSNKMDNMPVQEQLNNPSNSTHEPCLLINNKPSNQQIRRLINPFTPTPFYGYNQHMMHHSVTYPFVNRNDQSLANASTNTATNLFDTK
jgi:hypothetical protein